MSQTDTTAPPCVTAIRLRFAKTDELRFLSHHDMMRLMERLLRRTGLPFRSSSGFHPKPRITFASALGLGIVGRQEVVEIEFDGDLAPQDVLAELNSQAPPGLRFLSAQVPSGSRLQPTRSLYLLPLPAGFRPELPRRISMLLNQEAWLIQRIRHVSQRMARQEPPAEERLDTLTTDEAPRQAVGKTLDIRRWVYGVWRDEHGLWLDLAITNDGTARPEEILRLLDLESYWLDGHAVLERVRLDLEVDSAVTNGPTGARSIEPQLLAAGERPGSLIESMIRQ
jgi:radical SAM-linked protein